MSFITKRRTAAIVAVGVFCAALITSATAVYEVGWQATQRGLNEAGFALETATWPILSRAGRLVMPGADAREREVWQFMIRDYTRAPRGQTMRIALNPVASWPKQEQESPSQLADRILNGWSPRIGTPTAATCIHDFLAKNTRPARIDVQLPSGSRVVSYSSLERTFGHRFGWEEFSGANHVDAYLSLSRVGFNMLGTRALIYVELSCGVLCGHGEYYVLEKRRGEWVRVADQLKWIA